MNLHFKTNVSSMKPLHWQAYELSKVKAHQDTPVNHTENLMHPTVIVLTQQATRDNGSKSESSNPKATKPDFNERNEFLAFIKVLFRLLKINQENSRLRHAKKIVAECALRNRNGEANFALWKHSVDHRLHAVVGNEYWCQAQRYIDGYKYRRGLLSPSVASK